MLSQLFYELKLGFLVALPSRFAMIFHFYFFSPLCSTFEIERIKQKTDAETETDQNRSQRTLLNLKRNRPVLK